MRLLFPTEPVEKSNYNFPRFANSSKQRDREKKKKKKRRKERERHGKREIRGITLLFVLSGWPTVADNPPCNVTRYEIIVRYTKDNRALSMIAQSPRRKG